MTLKMQCNVFYNSHGFKVGNKYLSIYNAKTQKVVNKTLLTDALIQDLFGIKEEFESDDVNRTRSVFQAFNEHNLKGI